MATSEKAKAVLAKIEDSFSHPERMTDCMAKTLIRRQEGDDRPIDRWSWGNRFICAFYGTADARTFNQWKEAGRHVKKGAKAFYLLAPNTFKIDAVDKGGNPILDESGRQKKRSVVTGFRGFPVFRVEDTEGDPLPSYEPETLPPLLDVAEEWGINVSWIAAREGCRAYGSFSQQAKEIILLTHDESTFFHELTHAADARVQGGLKGGQDPDQEAVAEIGAAVLARMYGQQIDRNAYRYVESYEGEGKAARALLRLMPRIEKALTEILETAEKCVSAAARAAMEVVRERTKANPELLNCPVESVLKETTDLAVRMSRA